MALFGVSRNFVELSLYDTLGRNVERIQLNGNSGVNSNNMNTDYLSSGLYLVKIVTPTASKSLQIIIP